MKYYIVEHPTRGCFVERELEPGVLVKWKYRFSWSCLRTAEKVQPFFDIAKAKAIVAEVKGAYVLEIDIGPPPRRLVKTRRVA